MNARALAATLALNDTSSQAAHVCSVLQHSHADSIHGDVCRLHQLCTLPSALSQAARHSDLVSILAQVLSSPPMSRQSFNAWLSLTAMVQRMVGSGVLTLSDTLSLLQSSVPAVVSVLARWASGGAGAAQNHSDAPEEVCATHSNFSCRACVRFSRAVPVIDQCSGMLLTACRCQDDNQSADHKRVPHKALNAVGFRCEKGASLFLSFSHVLMQRRGPSSCASCANKIGAHMRRQVISVPECSLLSCRHTWQ